MSIHLALLVGQVQSDATRQQQQASSDSCRLARVHRDCDSGHGSAMSVVQEHTESPGSIQNGSGRSRAVYLNLLPLSPTGSHRPEVNGGPPRPTFISLCCSARRRRLDNTRGIAAAPEHGHWLPGGLRLQVVGSVGPRARPLPGPPGSRQRRGSSKTEPWCPLRRVPGGGPPAAADAAQDLLYDIIITQRDTPRAADAQQRVREPARPSPVPAR